ncbi:cyclic nucleotide-binding protein [Kribbella rubisoli]|uniref:Cyclic nucleotide-binding protein n=1 Tax=Kribbella rubisoli TaxID=3075929 RepID=A0A4V6MEZ9_9ACTN|nr:Crp/Fnr family transcriptional regulator [Kribbella rubisoli]RZU11346.1 cyclic nucleotide-binding protein [Kribbella rubisoli]
MVNDQHLTRLFRTKGVQQRLESGELLYEQGSEPQTVYYISDGRLALHRAGEDGSSILIAEKLSGDIVGESSALDGGLRTVSASATQSSEIMGMPSEEFRQELLADAGLCFEVAVGLARVLRSAT